MADTAFKLMIATPVGWAARSDAVSLTVPGTEGYLGILANHAPLMTELGVGMLKYRDTDGYDHLFAVTEGFLEVSNNVVTIIADAAETREEIDIKRAQEALERAQKRLNDAANDPSIDISRARAAYKRAINRIKIAEGQIK
jgi:F-type H+-transporting ATPase subunit epsilon